MSGEADVLIVGSGPSGVSAAWPLVTAGLKVTMLDQGRVGQGAPEAPGGMVSMRRCDPEQWRIFLGTDFVGLSGDGEESPKMKVPAHSHVHEGFAEAYGIRADGLIPTGSLARGGLSVMWGAGAYAYEETDLAGFPIDRRSLSESYRAVAARIGISGVADDDLGPVFGADLPLQPPLALHENARRLMRRYARRGAAVRAAGVRLGRARNAVLSAPLADRAACTLDNMCMWGCASGAIYSADQELPALSRHANFRYVDRAFVSAVAPDVSGYRLTCRDLNGGAAERSFTARTVVLAAGTVASTALVLRLLGRYDTEVPFICHPAFALVYCLPERIGAPLAAEGFALGQLAYTVEAPDGAQDFAFGVMFCAEGLLASDLARHIPLSRPGAARLIRALAPSLLLANCYLPGRYGDCTLRLQRAGEGDRVVLRGAYAADFESRMKDTVRRLSQGFRRLGAFLLPGGIRTARLGADSHYVGTLPMRETPDGLGTSTDCEVAGAPGLYVVDGAALPRLSAKHPTFTIMANADRAARAIARRRGSMR